MTNAPVTTSPLRAILAALLVATLTATSALPTAALARDKVTERPGAAKDKKTQGWKCGYVVKREKKYKPEHVQIESFDTRNDCVKIIKGKVDNVWMVRGFFSKTSDKKIRNSIADSANRKAGQAG